MRGEKIYTATFCLRTCDSRVQVAIDGKNDPSKFSKNYSTSLKMVKSSGVDVFRVNKIDKNRTERVSNLTYFEGKKIIQAKKKSV